MHQQVESARYWVQGALRMNIQPAWTGGENLSDLGLRQTLSTTTLPPSHDALAHVGEIHFWMSLLELFKHLHLLQLIRRGLAHSLEVSVLARHPG